MRVQIADWLCLMPDPPPVSFSEKIELSKWAQSLSLQERTLKFTKQENDETLPSPKPSNSIRICGWVNSQDGRFYIDQIWARAEFGGHKAALRGFTYEFFDIAPSSWVKCDIDVDHVINKSRVKKSHPHAWVMLFPVPRKANSPFGPIEYSLPKIDKTMASLALPPLMAFKLFCGRIPETPRQFRLAMKDVRGQVEGPYRNAMEKAASSHIRLTFAPLFYIKRLIRRLKRILGLKSKRKFPPRQKSRH